VESKSQIEEIELDAAVEKLRPAPTLYAIIVFKLAKGAVFFVGGVLLYWHASNGISDEYQHFMHSPFVEWLKTLLKIHPENQFFVNLALKIQSLSEASIRNTAVGTIIWSLFPLVEGCGMMFRSEWAGWLAIGESAFFIPIELFELSKRFSVALLLVTVTNGLIVWYLYANRQRLFHHHHHHHPRRS